MLSNAKYCKYAPFGQHRITALFPYCTAFFSDLITAH